jgi:hypothetical protein
MQRAGPNWCTECRHASVAVAGRTSICSHSCLCLPALALGPQQAAAAAAATAAADQQSVLPPYGRRLRTAAHATARGRHAMTRALQLHAAPHAPLHACGRHDAEVETPIASQADIARSSSSSPGELTLPLWAPQTLPVLPSGTLPSTTSRYPCP